MFRKRLYGLKLEGTVKEFVLIFLSAVVDVESLGDEVSSKDKVFIFLEAIKQLFPMVHGYWAQQTGVVKVQDVINAGTECRIIERGN